MEHRQIVLVVVRHQDERGRRHQRVLVDELRRDADAKLVDSRKALTGREPRPPVDHDGAIAEHLGELGERHRDVTGADHEEQGRRRENLDERAGVLEEERARGPRRHRLARLAGEPLVQRRVAERARGRAVVQDQDLRADRPIEPGDDCRSPAAARVGTHALQEVGGQRLDEHLDRPAARETDLPGFFVAEVQLEQPRLHRVQHVLGLLDDLRVHAPADGDGAEHGAALADEHLRAFFSRRRAPRVHERGDRDLARGASKFVNVIEEFRHGT